MGNNQALPVLWELQCYQPSILENMLAPEYVVANPEGTHSEEM